MTQSSDTGVLLDHLFRREAGRIIAYLARTLGPAHLDLAEESVQDAMLRALQTSTSEVRRETTRPDV